MSLIVNSSNLSSKFKLGLLACSNWAYKEEDKGTRNDTFVHKVCEARWLMSL